MWGIFSAGDWLDRGQYRGMGPLAIFLTLWHTPLFAAQWQLHPTLQLEEVYTDNVTLAPPGQTESDFVTGVNPGFNLTGQGGRVKANVNYQLQNYLYANDSGRDSSYQQLAATGNAELLKNIFFVDARSSINQQIINPQGKVGLDNINPVNTANVFTYGVSPYLKLKMDSYADAELRYDINEVEYQHADISSAQQQQYSLRMNSGPRFARLNWNVSYQQQDMNQSSAFDTHTKSALVNLRYSIVRSLNVLAYGGYEDNQVPASSTYSAVNGSYWSAGLEWLPSRHITASATAGVNDRTADLVLRPTERTSFHVGYSNQAVGLYTGPRWTADLSHSTRRTTWRASYTEQRTNLQALQFLGQQFFELQDKQGNVVIDPATGFPVVLAANVFGLVNDEYISKRSQATVTLNTGKSDVSLAGFNEHRDYTLNPQPVDVVGTLASWNWRFASRLHSTLSGSWQRTTQENPSQRSDLWYGSVALVRSISQLTNASLTYRYMDDTGSGSVAVYRENRVTLQVNMRF